METSALAPFQVQQKDKSDEEVAHAINQKLGDTPGISYSEIAARAYDCGRTELAIKVSWPGLWRVRLGGGMAGGVTRGGCALTTPLPPAAAGVRATLWGAGPAAAEDEAEQAGPQQSHRERGHRPG